MLKAGCSKKDGISILQNLNEKKNENYLIHNIMQDFYELG